MLRIVPFYRRLRSDAKLRKGDVVCDYYISAYLVTERGEYSFSSWPYRGRAVHGFIIDGLRGETLKQIMERCNGDRSWSAWRVTDKTQCVHQDEPEGKACDHVADEKVRRQSYWNRTLSDARKIMGMVHRKPHPFFVRDSKVKPAAYRKPPRAKKPV